MSTPDSGVYQIVNLRNGKFYIGSSKAINRRFYEHRRTLNTGEHHSVKLQRAWDKYGEGNFVFRVLLFCSVEDLKTLEQRCLDYSKAAISGYNILDMAYSMLGVRMSDTARLKMSKSRKGRSPSAETRQKLSIANKGKQNTLGRKLTEEHKKKIGAKSKGNMYRSGAKLSEKHIQALRTANLGAVRTDETRLKQSLAALGKKKSAESIRKRTETRDLNRLREIENAIS